MQPMHEVAEGVLTTEAAFALSRLYKVEMPITRQVQRILQDQISPRDAIRELMERTLKNE
jgi:glycerol-3-phosphate dehydrogenase (NAD(P)+)